MFLTAGKDFEFRVAAEPVYFGFGDQAVGEDYLEVSAMLDGKGLDLFDGGTTPVPIGFRKKQSCEIDFQTRVLCR